MKHPDPERMDAAFLTTLLEIGVGEQEHLQAEDLAQGLRHWLDTPLHLSLAPVFESNIARAAFRETSVHNLRELFLSSPPPIALLDATKQIAQQCSSAPESAVPA